MSTKNLHQSREMQLRILHEDNHILVVCKRAGMLTQGDRSGDLSLIDMLKEDLKERYRKPGAVFLGLVHRLDRPVSGILVFARTSKAAARLHRQFQGRTVVKCYLAQVSLAEGTAAPPPHWVHRTDWLERPGDRSIVVTEPGPGRQEAHLRYRCLSVQDRRALLVIRLDTGRKHQIRAQLAAAGMPVVGDDRYGSPLSYRPGAIALHSCCLAFRHPTTAEPLLFIDLPPRFFGGAFTTNDDLQKEVLALLRIEADELANGPGATGESPRGGDAASEPS